MERLTIPDVLVDEHTTRRTMIDVEAVREHAMDLYWRLKAYEDTHMMPSDVTSMRMDMAIIAALFNGIDVDRMKELAEADRDGRLVVLPFNKALTNADRIRAATNQQLAKLLYDNQKEFCRLMYKNLGFEDELEFSEDYSDILAWLNTSEKAEKALEAKKDE
jgi:hypothetical protein